MTQRQAPLGVGGYLAVAAMGILSTTVTIWTSIEMVSSCIDAMGLRNSILVDARVLDLEVVEHGEGADSYYFTYSYEHGGERYRHRTQRIALFARSNELHNTLRKALQTGDVVPCHIDPEQPSLSVFSKEFSVPLFLVTALFPTTFGAIAIIIAISLTYRFRNPVRDNRPDSVSVV
jgi:hypothetical protein